MKLEVSRGRCGVLMFLIDRDNLVESSEIIEPRVSRSLSLRTWRVSSIGIDPCVSIENVILAAAAVACVCLMFVWSRGVPEVLFVWCSCLLFDVRVS